MNYVVVALDASGSMAGQRNRVVTSMNEYVRTLPQDSHITVFMFDSARWLTYYTGLIETYRQMTAQDYYPDAMTPLYDAIGKAIAHGQTQAQEGDRVMVMIDTDGLENRSKEHSLDTIKSMVTDRQTAGWAFLFMSQGLGEIEAMHHAQLGVELGMATSPAGAEYRGQNYTRAAGQTVSYFVSGEQPDSMAYIGADASSSDPAGSRHKPKPKPISAGHVEKTEDFFNE